MGFVISTEDDIRLYHTGDTAIFSDLRLIGELHRPHILMIGISSVDEHFPAEMSINEAALATLWVAPDIVVAMHYPPGSTAPSAFLEAVKIMAPNVKPVLMEPNSEITYRKSGLKLG